MKPLLVGQDPAWLPTGGDRPAFVGSDSGERLAKLAGLESSAELLEFFDLDNVFREKQSRWDKYEADTRADEILNDAYVQGRDVVVFLGSKARDAAGIRKCLPMTMHRHPVYGGVMTAWMWHPSGLTRAWNDEVTREAARVFLTSLIGRVT